MSTGTPQYDVCVVGSGAAGGVMAKELSEGGAKVILLEGGKRVQPNQLLTHKWPYELPYRGLRSEKQDIYYQGDVRKSVRYEDSDDVGVDRIRVVGGRTVHWNAVTLRYAARDFRERSLNGIEEDWPISYEELAPYYERIEQMIGVTGQDDGLEILPGGQHYLPPLPWRCSEHILNRALKPMGIPMIPVRKAVLTRPYDNRPPCHYCGHCMDGCDVAAVFNSATAMIPKAQATGNFTLRQNALAREILVDAEGRARAVSFVDTSTGKEESVKAKVVVVCCATIETARLLLNSRSPQHPNGLANSSGAVGRYLSGHSGSAVRIYVEELQGLKPTNQDGATDHAFIPRYNHLSGKRNYVGGWDIQVNFASYMYPQQANRIPGYGADFKAQVRRMQSGYLMMGWFCKIVARPENRVTVDPNRKDASGIPIAVVHFRFGENDLAMWQDVVKSIREIGAGVKGPVFLDSEQPGGFASHEVGTARMGKDPQKSVLNGYCQAHDVKNLFVTDGSAFTTSAEKNPTLTIMALSLRTAEYIQEQRRRGEL
ncbi:MAG TPA: GMC family oxidoreductase [Terriglobia bacterium]|nr:GMC family oxidoreductase [Terriglobia bacterium]